MKRYRVGDILVNKNNGQLYEVETRKYVSVIKKTVYFLKKIGTSIRTSCTGNEETFDRAKIATIILSRQTYNELHSGPKVKFKYGKQFEVFRNNKVHMIKFVTKGHRPIYARFETVNFMANFKRILDVQMPTEYYIIITDLDLIR